MFACPCEDFREHYWCGWWCEGSLTRRWWCRWFRQNFSWNQIQLRKHFRCRIGLFSLTPFFALASTLDRFKNIIQSSLMSLWETLAPQDVNEEPLFEKENGLVFDDEHVGIVWKWVQTLLNRVFCLYVAHFVVYSRKKKGIPRGLL